MSRAPFLAVKPREIGSPKRAIAELVDQAGGVKRVQVRLQLGKSQVYAFTDPESPEEISFARVAALTQQGQTAAAEYLALLAGGLFLPIEPEDADAATLCADVARAHGEAMAAAVTALSAGKKTGKAAKALEKIDAALRTLTGLRAAVAEELK